MLHSKLKQAVATALATLALLAVAAPAAEARKPVAGNQPPPTDLILPILPGEPFIPCVCLPPVD